MVITWSTLLEGFQQPLIHIFVISKKVNIVEVISITSRNPEQDCQQSSESYFSFCSAPTSFHGARISGLETRVSIVEDRICDLDARGSEEADNLANDRDLDRFILTGE